METFIAQNYEELIEKCRELGFRGGFNIDVNSLIWHVTKHLKLRIVLHNAFNDEGYIEEWYTCDDGKVIPQGHWHPQAEEILPDLISINENEFAVLRKGLFGSRVITGKREDLLQYKNSFFTNYQLLDD